MTADELAALRSLDRARIKALESANADLQQQLAVQTRINSERAETVAKLARDVLALQHAAKEYPDLAEAKLSEVASAGRKALKRVEILAEVLRRLVAEGTAVQRVEERVDREAMWHIACREANELLTSIERAKPV
jgi:hypothetical protein